MIRIQFVELEDMSRGYLSNQGASANRRYRSALGVDLEFERAVYDRACPSAAVAELGSLDLIASLSRRAMPFRRERVGELVAVLGAGS